MYAGKYNNPQVSRKSLSSSIQSSDEVYYDASDNLSTDFVSKKIKPSSSKIKRPVSYESDSDLESVPTVSHFKQHTWKCSQSARVNQSSFNERKGIKSLLGKNGEYLEGKWQNNQLIEVFSFQFTHPDGNRTVYARKQSVGYLFTFDEEDFIARVCFNDLEGLSFAKRFTVDVKRSILKKLMVTEIIKDKLLSDRNTAYEKFKQFLQNRSSKTADNIEYAEDFFQLFRKLEEWKKFSNNTLILERIANNKNISHETNSRNRRLLDREIALDVRKKNFLKVDQLYTMDLLAELRKICKETVNNHRNTLQDQYYGSIFVMAPSVMVDYLSDLHDGLLFYISSKDMQLFIDLLDMMREQPFLNLVGDAWDALFTRCSQVSSSLKNFAPLTHPNYFYLCKSFQEIILEISGKTDISVNDLLKKNKQGKWSLIKSINWPLPSPLYRSLEQQYYFIFELMRHFEPGYYSDETKFKYEFKLLQGSNDKTWWQHITSWPASSNKSLDIPEERLIWIYVLDNAIAQLFPKESQKCLELFKPLLECYMSFIQEAKYAHYESFRVATHNVVRFVAQTSPYLSKGVSQTILTKQIESFKRVFLDKQFDDFRDLVDVYNEYWKKTEFILDKFSNKFPYGKFKQDMEEIRKKLLNITSTVLDKKSKSQSLINCSRVFNEFLEDLNAVEFIWFVKENNYFTGVELVNTQKKSYKVLDPENFIKKHNSIPNHYLIEIIQDLLNGVSNLLGQNKWTDDDNLNAASELLSAIKKSFLYLTEQPDYLSFDTFKEESTKPFICVIENSNSYRDFKKRINIIGKSFWYLRKQDEIDIEEALKLYRKENNNSTIKTEKILENCYNKYLKKFTFYIEQTLGKYYLDKIKFITEQVKKQSETIKIHNWDLEFKRETLPDLLAGLAAVWSIQASEDIVSTGKSLKPHCIQILCILRLLSVDEDSKGVDKHLAQVLTGQGKSLVLGLLSSLLALMGHRVRIVCYNEYLTTRDQQDFDDFFEQFCIHNKITYGTFEEMANEILRPEVNGKKRGLRELVEGRILNHNVEQSGQIKKKDISNTILLIDEVDVFFSDQFYGNTYGACTTIRIPALASIQEKIWEMADKSYEKSTILNKIEDFITEKIGKRDQDFKEFNKFRFKPGRYYLLKAEDKVIIKKEYNNQSFYREHLDTMIDNAIQVAKGNDKDWYINEFKINDDGFITCRQNNGIYSIHSYSDYYNTFNYFRLKKKDFNRENYGYFNINCGEVSYAKLPEQYPLILGVTGTLSMLNAHERKAIKESYSINKNSIMPSFFGHSNLQFDKNNDFMCQDSEEEWLNKIYSRANSKIGSGQSVLIFFDRDVEIDKFKEKFFSKFDRLHILTENTKKPIKEKYIDEAGITKTVTLATNGMGRGVDFKSSMVVEKNGGIHVIQTFFSLDIKEETQIKGRTARKDNTGSYELILCKKHLINAKFPEKSTANYESLSESREIMVKNKGLSNDERIIKSESNHKTTMDFLESFFTKKGTN